MTLLRPSFPAVSSLLYTLALLTALAGCTDGGTAERSGELDAGSNLADLGSEAPPVEPCIAGTAYCYDENIRAVCKPDGIGHVYERCGETEDGQPMNCDEETASCMAKTCEPSQFQECRDPKTAYQCNPSGTAFVEIGCDGCIDDDPNFPCLCKPPDEESGFEGGCKPLVCRPDVDWACLGDEERHQCNEDGTGWIFREDCNENGRARICEVTNKTEDGTILQEPMARCISLCEEAQKLKSYIGCEYWAADLDNAFVRGGNTPSGFLDAQGRQFAVVVSNVTGGDRNFVAEVTATNVDGELWCKPWGDWGPPFVHEPQTYWCYRNAEECAEGERCDIIIDYDAQGRRVATEVCLEASEGGGPCGRSMRVPPGELRVLNLSRDDLNGTMIAPKAFQLKSDVPITAYQFNPLQNEEVFSNDASLLLPINALAKDYIVMTREQTFDILHTFLTVVAVRPGETDVVVTTTSPTLPGPGIPALREGQRKRFTLRQFDVLNLESNCPSDTRGYCRSVVDFTGSEVYGNKLIAVFGGSEASNAPNTNHCEGSSRTDEMDGACWDGSPCADNSDCMPNNITCCADHLEQQLFPVSTWGTRYIASHSSPRGEPMGTGGETDVWRIVSAKDGTTITTIPHQARIPTLNRGEWFDFESQDQDDFEIHSSNAVMVGQFLAAEHAPGPNTRGVPDPNDARTGDPAFILAVPVEQYRDEYVVLAPDKYEHDFANLIAPTGTHILFDGQPLPLDQFNVVGDGEFSTLQLPIDDGIHHIATVPPVEGTCETNDDCPPGQGENAWSCVRDEAAGPTDPGECFGPRGRIGIIVYGYDQYVSYGYPGGLNLKRINVCGSDDDCPEGAYCCLEGMPCEEESVGECVGR